MTLFNIFVYYNEERSCCHTLLSPFILLLYPFWIVPVSVLKKLLFFVISIPGKGANAFSPCKKLQHSLRPELYRIRTQA
jgi:hypothetical protein